MCWITLTPKDKSKHNHHSSMENRQDSSIEYLVRRDRVSFESAHHNHLPKLRVATPSSHSDHHHHHHHIPRLHHGHHHHHHHLPHPLHFHPIRLHGHGRKRTPSPPPPSRCPSRGRSRSRSRNREPVPEADPIFRIQPIETPRPRYYESPRSTYNTTIIEPARQDVRETTRIALREVRPARRGLRRVAGYEVLNKQVPWSWDCVSSTVDTASSAGGASRKGKKDKRGLRYPPFGPSSLWL
ncbi:hypothetical protein B0J11DRAFT_510760 [Dendryphion nanum]|uniref:Uncharacterized protein n=1 Tax=Dendryphion nanum TaxID=256645 RepID=A0A9P9DA14_9PLEO|nr:hypothetical protein B0J11DRAFT_510760 [Dendryphion nanum]